MKISGTRAPSTRTHRGTALTVAVALLAALLSPVLSATTASAAPAPIGATAVAFRLSGSQAVNNAKVDWSAVSGARSYAILRSVAKDSGYESIATTAGLSYDDYGLAADSTLYYEVQALDADGTVLGVSDPAPLSTFSETGDYSSYSNTAASSLTSKSTLQSDSVYYRYDYQSDANGFTQLVQKTSSDGYTFSGSTPVLDRATLCASVTATTPGYCKLESVNIVKNPSTGNFVLWAHFENNADYNLAEIAVAEAVPGEAFVLESVSQPQGNQSRDLSFFADGANGYVISSTNNNADLNIYKLNADWTALSSDSATTVFAGKHREAPSMVHVGDFYYLFTSDTAGWYPSQGQYASATSPLGPWSALRNIGNSSTFGAQSGGVVKFGDQYAVMANRWGAQWKYPEASNTSRMLPLAFNAGYATYDYFATVDYSQAGGIVPVQDGEILSVGKPTRVSGLSSDAANENVLYSGDKANDGIQTDSDNYYKSDAVPFTWEVDLQSAAVLGRITLTTKLVNGSETYYSYKIDGSLDRKSYVTIADGSANRAVGFTSNEITSTDKFRYIRITVTKVVNIQNTNEADWARGLGEVTVYGKPSSVPAPDTVEAPKANVAAGTYYSAQSISLTSATDGADIYYTTDGTTPSRTNGTAYTAPIQISDSETLKAIAVLDGDIDSLVLSNAYLIKQGSTPTSLVSPVYAAAYVGQQPDLPATVSVKTAAGDTRDAAVVWDLEGYSFDNPYRSMTVYGVVEGSLNVSATVETVPSSIQYFIDSGMAGKTSPSFQGVKGLVGSALLNTVPDQASTSGSWGYVTNNSGLGGTNVSSTTDKDANGLYGQNSPSGAWLQYTLTNLPAGTYTVSTGHQEWWSGPRTMTVSVTNSSTVTSTLATGVTVGSNTALYSKTKMTSNTFTQTAAGNATINIYRSAGTEGPVIGWLAVAAGTVAVDTTPVVVATPAIDVPAGIYKTTQSVSLSTTTTGATIYYTTDGTTASRVNGTKYTGPISVDSTQTIKAVAFKNGTLSGVASAAYDIERVPATGYSTVPVGKTWYDASGTAIQAHGGNILHHGDWYYWVGENKSDNSTTFAGISEYKSKDLTNWTYVKDILTASSDPALNNVNVERPKLLYNAANDDFVLWAHWERVTDYSASHVLVATSATVDGDFTYLKNFRPGAGHVTTGDADPTYTGADDLWGYGSRDFTIFQDPDSADAYLVSTQDSNNMRVYKLTDDYTDVDWQNSYLLFAGSKREAPALVKSGDYYFVFTSSQSGWYPNQAMYSYTKDISDPNGWSALKPVGNNTTFYSQPTNILPITAADGSTDYVYMGDRWTPSVLGASTYVWLPLDFTGTTGDTPAVSMKYDPGWSLDQTTGALSQTTDSLVSENKPVEATAQQSSDYPTTAANDGIVVNTNTSGDNTNYYQPSTTPYYWSVDLGQKLDLSRIDLSFRSYNGSETYSGYTVEGSNDDATWTTLVRETANKTVGFKSNALTGAYRYVRVDVTSVVNDHNGSEADWAAGLVEVQVYADLTAPTVTINLPAAADSGWYTHAPVATIAASDSSTGVDVIQYRLGTTGDWTDYTGPVTLHDATTLMQARASDKAGNESDPVSKTVKIDTVAPTARASVSGSRVVTLTGDDANSVSVQYSIDSGPWTTYSEPVKLSDAAQTIAYRAVDAAGNSSDTAQLRVAAAPISTSVTLNAPGAARAGHAYTLGAVVAPAGATGSVEFFDGTTAIGSAAVVSGSASFTIGDLAAGTHQFSARFHPADPGVYTAATSSTSTVTAAKSDAHLVLSPSKATYGTAAKVTVRVTSGGQPATGTVKIRVAGVTKTGTLRNGVAVITLASNLSAGKHTIAIAYSGDSATNSASLTRVITVAKAASSTTVTLSSTHPRAHVTVVKATVRVTVKGSTIAPTGKVVLKVGGTTVRTVTLRASKTGTISVVLPRFSHRGVAKLTARYTGSTNVKASTSKVTAVSVRR